MKASAVSEALRVLVAARRPVFIWGGPGVGKSSVVMQLAETLNVPLQDVRALLLDPVDLRGLPFLGSDGGIFAAERIGHSLSGRTECGAGHGTSQLLSVGP